MEDEQFLLVLAMLGFIVAMEVPQGLMSIGASRQTAANGALSISLLTGGLVGVTFVIVVYNSYKTYRSDRKDNA